MAESTKRALPRRLLAWFDRHQRDLPWRRTRAPYQIWVSEIMLQQTRVEAVVPYYHRWLRKFPTLASLARARPASVLKAWEGLGYYQRARNLHAAARKIWRERGGRFPRAFAAIRALPGVGRYTAGAIASMAFGERVPVVDGNVSRVLARVFVIRHDIRATATQKRLWTLAETLVPRRSAGDFNQALMELGATVCLPRNPRCDRCPVASLCLAREKNLQRQLPLRGARPRAQSVIRLAAIVRRNGTILLTRRPRKGRLANFWELPSVELARPTHRAGQARKLRWALQENHGLRVSPLRWRGQHQHCITKFAVTLEIFETAALGDSPRRDAARWVNTTMLGRLALPAADRHAIQQHVL